MSDNRGSVYLDGDVAIYRASAVGSCMRRLWAYRMGSFTPLPTPESMQQRFDDGNLHEPAILAKLIDKFDVVFDDAAQEEVEIALSTQVKVRGHVDAIGDINGTKRVIECKALAQSGYDNWIKNRFDTFPYYADQLTVYMTALGLPGLFVVKNKNSGAIDVFEVDETPSSMLGIEARVLQVEGFARRGEMPPCEESWPCPFVYLHEGEKSAATAVDADTGDEITALAASYDEARARVAEAEAVKNQTRDLLMARMGTIEKVEVGEWRVNQVTTTRKNLDKKKVEAKLTEIGEDVGDYEIATASTALRVTRLVLK